MLAGMWATPALADPYVSASVGLGFIGNSDASSSGLTVKDMITYKTAVPFGAAVGIKNDGYRVEAALGYQASDVDKIKNSSGVLAPVTGWSVSVLSYMANGYYDVAIKDSGVSPYLMAGFGGASITAKIQGSSDETKSVFAWQVGAGVGIKTSDHVTVDLGYRYINPSDFTVSGGSGNMALSCSSSNILAGVRYGF